MLHPLSKACSDLRHFRISTKPKPLSNNLQAALMETGAHPLVLRVLAASDRTQRELGALCERWTGMLQPTAELLGARLGVPPEAVDIFSEEVFF